MKTTLLELFNKSKEPQFLTETTCNDCNRIGTYVETVTVKDPSQYIVLALKLFECSSGTSAKIGDVKLSSLLKTVLRLADYDYVFKNAIFHHGNSIESGLGHYTSILKKSQNYIKADDTNIKKERWPLNAKNIYFIFERK